MAVAESITTEAVPLSDAENTEAESSEKESEVSEDEDHTSDDSSSSSSCSSTTSTTDDTEMESNVSETMTDLSEIFTYKLVGDNIDKDVKPRQMRCDYQTRSLHYFHTFAVKDRVDISSLSDKPLQIPADVDLTKLLPNKADDTCLQKNFAVLMARVVCKYVPFFSRYTVERHIEHKYSREMSAKSVVVSI